MSDTPTSDCAYSNPTALQALLSARSEVEPFRVMQMLDRVHERRRQGKETLLLCVGQPATGAPKAALDAVAACLYQEPLGYTEVVGNRSLREAIAAWHRANYPVDTTADEVVVTTGSSAAFVSAFLCFLEPGDTVALTAPGYPAYSNILRALGARIQLLPVTHETRFQPTAAMLDALDTRPKMVIVTSPGNPTGTIIDPEELARIATWCADNGVILLSDEDYHGMSFGRPLATARQFTRLAVSIGTFSKYFSMTGWRVGWMILDPVWAKRVGDLQSSLSLCPPAVSQVAAEAALSEEAISELDGHVARYAQAREILLRELPAMGLGTFADPDGGLYVWVDVSELTDDSEALALELIDKIGVAVAPGVDFDPLAGKHWIRLSLCASVADTQEACRRLGAWVRRKAKNG